MAIFKNKDINFDINEVIKFLPHRYPFLLVDKIASLDSEGGKIVGIKNVTINEPFFQGHFPSRPIMPGVLIIEAMAQVAGIYAVKQDESLTGSLFYFLGLENAKFRHPVIPGDVLKIQAILLKYRMGAFKFKCEAFVENKIVTEATLTAQVIRE